MQNPNKLWVFSSTLSSLWPGCFPSEAQMSADGEASKAEQKWQADKCDFDGRLSSKKGWNGFWEYSL